MIYGLSFILVCILNRPRAYTDKRNYKKYIYNEVLKEWDSLQIPEP